MKPRSGQPRGSAAIYAASLLAALGGLGCSSGDFVVARVLSLGGSSAMGTAGADSVAGGGAAATGGGGGEAGATAPNCTGNVLFVLGSDTTTLTRGDSALLDRLRGLGFVVSLISDTMVTDASADGSDFVFISRSVRSPMVMASFRERPIPLFVTEYNLYPSLGMTDASTSSLGGDTLSVTDLVISEPTHPLAAGLSGTVTILTAGKGQYGWGVPGSGAVLVATLVDETKGAAIFGYEQGSPLFGLAAPARRVGWFLDIQASTRLTDQGWALFDAGVRWTAGTCAIR